MFIKIFIFRTSIRTCQRIPTSVKSSSTFSLWPACVLAHFEQKLHRQSTIHDPQTNTPIFLIFIGYTLKRGSTGSSSVSSNNCNLVSIKQFLKAENELNLDSKKLCVRPCVRARGYHYSYAHGIHICVYTYTRVVNYSTITNARWSVYREKLYWRI
jgi:hypothetical protein